MRVCACRYTRWQVESKARQMEQSSLLERLQQLLHQSLQSNLAKTVSTACPTSSNFTWLQASNKPPGFATKLLLWL